MSRKRNSAKSNPVKTEKTLDKTAVYVALIGLAGAIMVAIINSVSGYINTRTQILLPISLTQTLLPTKTSVPAYVATPFVCGSGTAPAINTPVPINPKPTLVVVTIDEAIIDLTTENILRTLDSSLQIGDRVIILANGIKKYNDAVIADETVMGASPYPILPPSPTPRATLTSLPAQTPGTTLHQIAATATARAAIVQATQISEQNLCNLYQWNYSNEVAYFQWKVESQKNVSIMIDSLRQKIQDYVFHTPPSVEFESLSLASNIFAIECNDKSFGKCVFVPTTIMQESRKQQIETKADFSNVEVIGTMTNCTLYEQECRDNVALWENYFKSNNARSVQFVNLNDFWSLLTDVIKR